MRAVRRREEAARGAEAGADVEDVLVRLEGEFRGEVDEGEVAVVVHGVEGGGVAVGPFGFGGGEGGEDGVGAGEVVEGYGGDLWGGWAFGAEGFWLVGHFLIFVLWIALGVVFFVHSS